MAKKTLLIRSDASTHIGTGHVMRCLALAQAWQDNGGAVTFLMAPGSLSLQQRILTEGMDILEMEEKPGSEEDATLTAEIANNFESSWIIVDGYQFGAKYQKILKEKNAKVLFIDDYGHADHYYADIVLNQNIYADMSYYKKYEPDTQFLLGTKYALLRREFLKWSGWHREIPKVAKKILVTLGGSDPFNITLSIIEALKKLELGGMEVVIVVGNINSHIDTLEESIRCYPKFSVRTNVTNMPELMAWGDIAISAGGSTCWELAFMGLPFCIITLAENQLINSEKLYENRIAEYLGRYEEIKLLELTTKINNIIFNQKARNIMSQDARQLVTGKGAQLIIQEMIA
jgi:UDP-2,4-diacetamido-2,4,6-trideoxy-beta-L-altropyranose hydrolase